MVLVDFGQKVSKKNADIRKQTLRHNAMQCFLSEEFKENPTSVTRNHTDQVLFDFPSDQLEILGMLLE